MENWSNMTSFLKLLVSSEQQFKTETSAVSYKTKKAANIYRFNKIHFGQLVSSLKCTRLDKLN